MSKQGEYKGARAINSYCLQFRTSLHKKKKKMPHIYHFDQELSSSHGLCGGNNVDDDSNVFQTGVLQLLMDVLCQLFRILAHLCLHSLLDNLAVYKRIQRSRQNELK